MSYIEREPLIKILNGLYKHHLIMRNYVADGATFDCIGAVIDAPTSDVAPVRHGKWYKHDKKKHGDTCYYCSVCEKMALADCMVWELTDYCPHCGAKMGGERREE